MVDLGKDVQILIRDSLKADLNEFTRLTDKTVGLLKNETQRVGNMRIVGHLIEAPAEGEAIVVGDLHGDLDTLAEILSASEFMRKANRGEHSRLFFLGDYGDRGALSAEVYYAVMLLKTSFPEHVVLLRGNHEGPEDLQASPHDLPIQLHDRFGEKSAEAYTRLGLLFSLLYNAVLIKGSCILLHGGVPSKAESIDDVANAHTNHPRESHLEEILWSDPQEDLEGTLPSPRGAGRLFGRDVTESFLERVDARVLIRGHEPADAGFKINHDGRILTVFSRRGEPYFNSRAAFLQSDLTENLKNAFQLKRFVRQL